MVWFYFDQGGKEIKLLQYHSNLARQFRVHQDTVLANLDYSLLPAELRPGVKKRMKGARPRVEAKRTRPNLEERLHNLEDKEKNENEDEDEDEGYYFSKDYFPLTTIFQFWIWIVIPVSKNESRTFLYLKFF